MKTIAIYETESSQAEYREVPTAHAHKLGQNGGFYKVQIIDEFGIIEVEYK
jgi:hypothetical protein